MEIEGERSPRFQAHRITSEGHVLDRVFECNEASELERFKPRADWLYKWKVDGHWLTASEFAARKPSL